MVLSRLLMCKNGRLMHLSLIIPAYNEVDRIGNTLEHATSYLRNQSYASEIIVVDDGSSDSTQAVVLEQIKANDAANKTSRSPVELHVVALDHNQGKGYAVRYGMLHIARGDYRVYYDADSATPIEELEKVWAAFNTEVDIVIGSRALPDSDVELYQPWYRVFMGRTFNVILHFMKLTPYQDTQCGFKGFTAEATKAVFQRQTLWRFSFDVELLYIARLLKFRIAEIPVRWRNDPCSKVHAIRDSGRMFFDLGLIRIRALLGLYL